MKALVTGYALLCLCLCCHTALLPAVEPSAPDPFAGAPYRLRHARTGRVSSWDRTGDNRDFISFQPGETKELLSLDGPGALTHLYMTPAAPPVFLRTAVLRIFWDDEASPSVEAPFGDFFCAGECSPRLFASHYVVVNHGSGTIAYNSYFPMPFRKRARVTLENTGTSRVEMFWYHIEYERYEQPLPADTAYFHAQWRREKLTRVRKDGPEAVPPSKVNQAIWAAANKTGADNYVILEAQGAGHLVGFCLTCHNLAGGWWGEGDDMIFIDGEGWPPSYHGTGTEEIFGGGACPNQEYAGPYTGFVAIQEQGGNTWRGQNSMYRWFVHDPIRFQKSLRWTIEHGHANNFENDYSSVAYWYQTSSSTMKPSLLLAWSPQANAARFKSRIFFDESVREHWKTGVRKLLQHENPYTKTHLADDPVVAIVLFFNEQNLNFYRSIDEGFTAPWHAWLKKKYGTTATFRAAWTNAAGKCLLADGVTLDNVPLFEPRHLWQTDPRARDVGLFVNDLHAELLDWFNKTVRDIGYAGLTTHYDWLYHLGIQALRNRLPVISMHGYHAHPTDFVTKGSKISQESAVAAANRLFCSMTTTRYGNRPSLVTEYGQVFWNRYRYEEGLLIGAYAAFQAKVSYPIL